MIAKIGGRKFVLSGDRLKGAKRQRGAAEPGVRVATPDVSAITPSAPQLSGWPKREDKWNFAYAQELDARKKAGDILDWFYEPHAWRLADGVSHNADFMVWVASTVEPFTRMWVHLEIHEVKGWSRNLRDGITRFKLARERYPCFVWRMMKREKGRFVEIA